MTLRPIAQTLISGQWYVDTDQLDSTITAFLKYSSTNTDTNTLLFDKQSREDYLTSTALTETPMVVFGTGTTFYEMVEGDQELLDSHLDRV